MQAFRNSEEFKNELIGLAALHREQDQYIKGDYGKMNGSFKGCSVGCLIYDINKREGTHGSYSDHRFLAEQLGVPEFICSLQDSIFEGLPEPLNTEWTERLLKAIPVGVDLTPVLPKFLLRVLDKLPETDRQDVVDSIQGVKAVLENWSVTGAPDLEAAEAARAAAAAEAAEAAWAAQAAEEAAWAAQAAAEAAWAAQAAAEAAWAAQAAAATREAAEAAWAAQAAAEAAWAAAAVATREAAEAAWEQIANDIIELIEDQAA